VPPRFRLRAEIGLSLTADAIAVETVRPDGIRQNFTIVDRGGYLESVEEIPEPHAFAARVRIAGEEHTVLFEEHKHAHRDNNMRVAAIHVIADATVSVFVIAGCSSPVRSAGSGRTRSQALSELASSQAGPTL